MNEFEKKLKSLEPMPGGLARDRLLFEAGRRSARPSRVWPISSACLTLLCIGLSIRLLGMTTSPAERVAAAPAPGQPSKAFGSDQAKPPSTVPTFGPESRDPLSIGSLQQAMLKTGTDRARPSAEIVAAGPIRPSYPPSVLNLETEAMPVRIPASMIWPAWLSFGGAR